MPSLSERHPKCLRFFSDTPNFSTAQNDAYIIQAVPPTSQQHSQLLKDILTTQTTTNRLLNTLCFNHTMLARSMDLLTQLMGFTVLGDGLDGTVDCNCESMGLTALLSRCVGVRLTSTALFNFKCKMAWTPFNLKLRTNDDEHQAQNADLQVQKDLSNSDDTLHAQNGPLR